MIVLLKPAELLYRGVNRIRRAMYRSGVLTPRRLPKPVISVGNIAIGGAGKTPAVIALCRFLEGRGGRVAVLTRGYGASGTGAVTELDADRFGDEPVLIKRSTKSTTVIVGANRYENASQVSCDVFVLDDAFQHLQLHRDLDIVIDAPARFFREGRSALGDADIVVPRRLRLLVPDSVRGRKAFAFAGLANNDQFFQSLRAEGVQLDGTRSFPDHHRYGSADLAAVRDAARNTDAIVTTEKDWVKIRAADIIAVPAEFIFDDDVLQRVAAVAGL
ncbi:MAG TPA: tetraacyldisaccharide 4'-kinase [Thermoanaerobaculia bacterium]|nr:tetraacyldisaccharide 4'-kinase [Thermoanaerobaculia bacterium]